MFEECLDPETNEYIIGATFQLPKRCLLGVCREDFTVGVSGYEYLRWHNIIICVFLVSWLQLIWSIFSRCSNYYKTQLEEKKSHCIEIEGNNDALFPECCPKIQC